MRIETHLLAGATLGLAEVHLFSFAPGLTERIVLGGIGFIAAGIPHIPLAIEARIRGVSRREKFWLAVKEMTHSPLLWVVAFFITLATWPTAPRLALGALAFTLGLLAHWLIDLIARRHPASPIRNLSLSWPLRTLGFLPPKQRLAPVIEKMTTTTKEKIFQAACVILIIALAGAL